MCKLTFLLADYRTRPLFFTPVREVEKRWLYIFFLNLPTTKVAGFLRTKGFLVHLRAELALVPQDFHGQTP